MLRKAFGLTSVPFRRYYTDTPCKINLDDAPYSFDDHDEVHYPHVEEDTVRRYSG